MWREKVEREKWIVQLASWANCSLELAQSILERGELEIKEMNNICKNLHISEDELVYAFENSGIDILSENLKYLVLRGRQKDLAEAIGVHNTNISKWKSGKQRPERKNLEKLNHYFSLPESVDLASDPLFLSLHPVTPQQRRKWITERLEKISSRRLAELFPALECLLERDD